jgi:TPR repeat protein
VPNISAEKARNLAQQTGTWFRTAASGAGRGFRSASNFLPDLSHVSLENTRQHMRRAREIAASAVQNTGFRTDRLSSLRLKVHFNGRALRRSASAFAILVIMAAFLVMESGLFRSDTMAAASAHHEAQAANAASPLSAEAPVTNTASVQPNDRPAVPRTHATTGPTSHLVITDPSIEDTVQNLTRYEVTTLRRQADSGDEEAAFQLGMVYEIGYNVKRNCAKAAEWVARSAAAGYPPAQYNLGLRYRDGDGVAVNAADAEKWLNKAAAGKYRPARVAVAKLMPHER